MNWRPSPAHHLPAVHSARHWLIAPPPDEGSSRKVYIGCRLHRQIKSLLPVAHWVQFQLLSQPWKRLFAHGEVCLNKRRIGCLLASAELHLLRLVFLPTFYVLWRTESGVYVHSKSFNSERELNSKRLSLHVSKDFLLFTGNCLQEALFLDILTSKELDNVSKLNIHPKQRWIWVCLLIGGNITIRSLTLEVSRILNVFID